MLTAALIATQTITLAAIILLARDARRRERDLAAIRQRNRELHEHYDIAAAEARPSTAGRPLPHWPDIDN